jgi:hypothetical protein
MSYELSAISYQLSAISYRLSAIGYELSAISYQLSAISYQLSARKTKGPTFSIETQNPWEQGDKVDFCLADS